MMNEDDIETALGQRLATLTTANPIAWPNRDHSGARPHLKFEIVRVSKRDDTLDGTNPIHRGYAMITAVTDAGGFSKEGNDLAASVEALFPKGLKLNITGGVVQIMKPAEAQTPFPRDSSWNTPVRVDYEAF